MRRAYNFNAGPAALPLAVLQRAQAEMTDYQGTGMSVMELSHRSDAYESIQQETQRLVSELLSLPSNYKVLFCQGGASLQFAMVPMNLMQQGKSAAYVQTGSWSSKAYQEAVKYGQAVVAADSSKQTPLSMPKTSEIALDSSYAYLHLTSNETISGAQFSEYPNTGDIPLIGDLSSDIMSRSIDAQKFSLIYAGAQKNLGPSGVTLVILRDELLATVNDQVPTMLRYDTYIKNNSLYNTPPAYSVYMVKLVLEWILEQGGIQAVEKLNREKSGNIYQAIDNSGGFYGGLAAVESRSLMNVTFSLNSERLEQQFLDLAEAEGFVGLGGHRSVGHLRASTYNAVPAEHCQALVDLMQHFQSKHG